MSVRSVHSRTVRPRGIAVQRRARMVSIWHGTMADESVGRGRGLFWSRCASKVVLFRVCEPADAPMNFPSGGTAGPTIEAWHQQDGGGAHPDVNLHNYNHNWAHMQSTIEKQQHGIVDGE